jgi:hypothetical protein
LASESLVPRTTNFHEISLDFESETIFHFCVDFLKQQMLYTRVVATGVEEQQQTFIFVFSYSNKHLSVQEGWNMVEQQHPFTFVFSSHSTGGTLNICDWWNNSSNNNNNNNNNI